MCFFRNRDWQLTISGLTVVLTDEFDLTDAKEATLTYSVLFEDDFDFNMGGKLPGICQ